jgi:hypothetical protein
VVGQRVTDFLDLNYVIHASAENWFEDMPASAIASAETAPVCAGEVK